MPEVGVVHLVRRKNGIAPLKSFLSSYESRPAGREHALVIALKGFGPRLDSAFKDELGRVKHETLSVSDHGFDISAYRAAGRALSCRFLCFLNSFSVIQCDDWLAKLYSTAMEPSVGLVGASGSWQSLESNYHLQQMQPFRSVLDPAVWAYRALRYHTRIRGTFPPFPNAHVRTNGFLIERELFLQSDFGPLLSKMDNYCFESGFRSLSKQVTSAGLGLRIAGRDGKSYRPEEWPNSRTLWSAEQENLIIADNQSRAYERGDAAMRTMLWRYAWDAVP